MKDLSLKSEMSSISSLHPLQGARCWRHENYPSRYLLGLSHGAQPYEVGGLGVLRLHLKTFKHAQQNLFFVTAILDKSPYDSDAIVLPTPPP